MQQLVVRIAIAILYAFYNYYSRKSEKFAKPPDLSTFANVGTCLSFSHEDKNLFVVGAENGSIFKCSMQSPVAEEITGVWAGIGTIM